MRFLVLRMVLAVHMPCVRLIVNDSVWIMK